MGVAGSSRGGGRGRGGDKPKPRRAAGPASRSGAGANGDRGSAAGVVKATIPSDYNAGRDLQERILDDVQRHGFSADGSFAIRIALEEALVNAIKHGNAADPD